MPKGLPASAMDAAKPFRFERGGFILVVSGPSGAGKGTLIERLMRARPECMFSVSATSRPRRGHETDGVEYEFLTREDFDRRVKAGYFLEHAEVHGHLYGTPAKAVDEGVKEGRIVVLDIDVQGGESVRKARPEAVSVFVFPPSLAALRERLAKRATDRPEVVEHRMANAPGEIAEYVHYDYLVVNDQIEAAADELIGIADAELARVRRIRVTQ